MTAIPAETVAAAEAETLSAAARRVLAPASERVRKLALEQLAAALGYEVAPAGTLARRTGQVRTVELLSDLPVGFSFSLGWEAGRAYRGRYVRNAAGTWDQVPGTCEAPHVVNMSASSLGFAVDYAAIKAAVAAASA